MAASGLDTAAATGPAAQRAAPLSGAFGLLLGRGLRLAWRRPLPWATALLFFVLVAALWPLATQPLGAARASQAVPAAWVAMLLAALLASQRLFADDADSGVLDQLLAARGAWPGAVAGLLAAHALTISTAVLLAVPAIAVLHDLDAGGTARLAASLLLGTPAVCLLAALGAALTLPARGAALLLPLLVLPWCVPLLLFGIRAAQPALDGGWAFGPLALLAALSLAAAALVPPAVAAALRSLWT
jgi:heme exporter protein B